MTSKKIATVLLVAMLAIVLIGAPGCYGKFNMTRQVYNWNTDVGTKWVNELVFVGCVIIPVYGVTMFCDGIIFNSIEFWGGNNPINEPSTTMKGPDEARE